MEKSVCQSKRLEQLQWAVVRIIQMEFLRCNSSSATVTKNFSTNDYGPKLPTTERIYNTAYFFYYLIAESRLISRVRCDIAEYHNINLCYHFWYIKNSLIHFLQFLLIISWYIIFDKCLWYFDFPTDQLAWYIMIISQTHDNIKMVISIS